MKTRLSECETLEDIENFVPTNQDRLYYDGKGRFYEMDLITFMIDSVSNGKAKFKPVVHCPGYFSTGGTYSVLDDTEFFTNEQEANKYQSEKEREKRERRIHELESELARLRRM